MANFIYNCSFLNMKSVILSDVCFQKWSQSLKVARYVSSHYSLHHTGTRQYISELHSHACTVLCTFLQLQHSSSLD